MRDAGVVGGMARRAVKHAVTKRLSVELHPRLVRIPPTHLRRPMAATKSFRNS